MGLPIPQEFLRSLAPAKDWSPRNITVPQSMQTPLYSPAGIGTAEAHHEQESSMASSLRLPNFPDMMFAAIVTFLS
jgi:hypothetical protein